MKRLLLLPILIAATACTRGAGGGGASTPAPQTEDQKTLYALGLAVGRNLQQFNLTPQELAYVEKGLADQVQNKTPDVDITTYGPKIQDLARTRAQARAVVEKGKSKEFLDAAAKEPGAEKLADGLVFKSLQPGTGPSPTAADRVKVHYRGTLTDGTEFDSSIKRGTPAEFPLGGVIKCWTEGLQKMKVGGKAKLVCPSDIAYGDQGRPPSIPGGATLTFEVELLSIESGPPGGPAMTPNAAGGTPPKFVLPRSTPKGGVKGASGGK
jgi:FKBP-type peptidyl-prolyl cis-trans isomerase FkpA